MSEKKIKCFWYPIYIIFIISSSYCAFSTFGTWFIVGTYFLCFVYLRFKPNQKFHISRKNIPNTYSLHLFLYCLLSNMHVLKYFPVWDKYFPLSRSIHWKNIKFISKCYIYFRYLLSNTIIMSLKIRYTNKEKELWFPLIDLLNKMYRNAHIPNIHREHRINKLCNILYRYYIISKANK